MERVHAAAMVAKRRPQAGGARPRRRDSDAHPRLDDEARSLRRVFLDMGDSYREYRRRTGARVSPDVRGAAEGFRRKPSVVSLTAVAASLDELNVLTW